MSSQIVEDAKRITEPRETTVMETLQYVSPPFTIYWSRHNETDNGVVNGSFVEWDLLTAVLWGQAKMVDENYLGVKIVSSEGLIYCVKKDGKFIDYNGW